jgi:hypothetical protein
LWDALVSGFSLSFIDSLPINGISGTACFQDIADPGTTTASESPFSILARAQSAESRLYPNGLRVHNAWHISWEASDVVTLSPPPPRLPCPTSVLSTWVPGATVDPNLLGSACDSNNDGTSHMSESETRVFWFLVIGLPIILLTLVATCFGVWCHRRRKARKAKTQTPADVTREATSLPKTGGT